MSDRFIQMTQGPAVLADAEALQKDENGFTHPNLHRRIKVDRPLGEDEHLPREYALAVYGVDSYRTTESFVHDEESTTEETP